MLRWLAAGVVLIRGPVVVNVADLATVASSYKGVSRSLWGLKIFSLTVEKGLMKRLGQAASSVLRMSATHRHGK